MTRLDLKGLKYTMPLVRLAKAVKAAGPGDVIEAVSDYLHFEQDVRMWCRDTGHELRQVSCTNNSVTAVVVKQAAQG